MSFDEGSPPGHPAFFVVSTAGGDVAPDIAAVHDLQLALGLRAAAADVDQRGQPDQGSKSSHHILLHSLFRMG